MIQEIYKIVRLNKLIFAGFAGMLAVTILIGGWLVYDKDAQLIRLQEEYGHMRRIKNRGDADAIDPYMKAKEDIHAFYDRLESKKAFLSMVGEFKALLNQTGLGLPRMTFKPDFLSESSVWKYQTSCTITGSYPDLKKILATLQASEGVFCIDQLTFYRDAPGRETMRMAIDFTTYYKENSGLTNGQE